LGLLEKLKEIFGLKKKKGEKIEEKVEEKVEKIHEEELRKEVVLPGTEHLEAGKGFIGQRYIGGRLRQSL